MRRVFTLCSAFSLLLCVVVCVLWVRSYFSWQKVKLAWGTGQLLVETTPGHIGFSLCWGEGFGQTMEYWEDASIALGRSTEEMRAGWPKDAYWDRWGMCYFAGHVDFPLRQSLRVFMASSWQVVAVLATCPTLLLLRRFRCRLGRHGDGLCPACGYDLRATPDRGPECGTASVR